MSCTLINLGWVAGSAPFDLTFDVDVDLTGFTMTLQLQQPDGDLVSKTGTITAAASSGSTFSFAFAGADLEAGVSNVRVFQEDGSGNSVLLREFSLEVAEAWS